MIRPWCYLFTAIVFIRFILLVSSNGNNESPICKNPMQFKRIFHQSLALQSPVWIISCTYKRELVELTGMVNYTNIPDCLRNQEVTFMGNHETGAVKKWYCRKDDKNRLLVSPTPRAATKFTVRPYIDSNIKVFNCSVHPANLHRYYLYITFGQGLGVSNQYVFNMFEIVSNTDCSLDGYVNIGPSTSCAINLYTFEECVMYFIIFTIRAILSAEVTSIPRQ